MTHTPGPWKAGPPRGVRVMLPDDTVEITNVNGGLIAVLYKVYWSGSDEANARLIAAAPDMLDALQALILYEDDNEGAFLSGDTAKARAAIAKATGGSHEPAWQRVQLLNFENDMLREEIARLRDPTRQGDKT